MTLTLIPDAEKLVGSLLRDHADIEALDARVAGTIPSNTRSPWIRVTQLDGTKAPGSRPDYLISYLLQVDCYAGQAAQEAHTAQGEASTLARTARAVLQDSIGQSVTGGVITDVQFTSMARLPDTAFDPARERYILDAEVWIHP